MSYTFHFYKSKLGYPDAREAISEIENCDPITEADRKEIFEIAYALATFNPGLEFKSNDDSRIAQIQNRSIRQIKESYFQLTLKSEDLLYPNVDFLNQSITLNISYPYYRIGTESEGMENLMAYLKIISKASGCFVYDEQALHAFDPLKALITIEEGIITYYDDSAPEIAENNFTPKKSWWRFW